MVSNQPLVSVVMGTFNGGKFVESQLNDIINQTWQNLEILIFDDGSTDETISIIEAMALKDSRIRLHMNAKNLGYNKNFEQGFIAASGAYISIADQDDIWLPEKIEKTMALFTTPDVLVAYNHSFKFSGEPPLHHKHYNMRNLLTGGDECKSLFYNTISGHSMIFKKSLLQYVLPLPATVFYDWWLVTVALCHGTINATNEVLSFHRMHSKNASVYQGTGYLQIKEEVNERVMAIEQFIKIPAMEEETKQIGLQLLQLMKELQQRKFSLRFFLFLAKHSNRLLYFKRDALFNFRRIKYAFRHSWNK